MQKCKIRISRVWSYNTDILSYMEIKMSIITFVENVLPNLYKPHKEKAGCIRLAGCKPAFFQLSVLFLKPPEEHTLSGRDVYFQRPSGYLPWAVISFSAATTWGLSAA